MKHTLKKLTHAILPLALIGALILPTYASEINTHETTAISAVSSSVHYDGNTFNDEFPMVVVEILDALNLGELLTPEG